MTMPSDFATEFETWWDDLIVEARRRKSPYLTVQEALTELAALPVDAPERPWIYEILIGWLASDDAQRWQAALAILSREEVSGAPSAMRAAVSPANTDEKRRFTDTFNRTADKLEQALKDEGGEVDSL